MKRRTTIRKKVPMTKASRFSMTIYWLTCRNFERTPSCDKKETDDLQAIDPCATSFAFTVELPASRD
jgi:hypothetical protein